MVMYGVNEDGLDHNQTLMPLLQITQANNLKHNPDKCIYHATLVSFFGHLLSIQGLKPDLNKVKYIVDIPQQAKVSKLQSFLGLMNYMSRFFPELS